MSSRKRARSDDEPGGEGFPEEIFINMSDDDKQDYQCNIWQETLYDDDSLQIVRDPVICTNVHLFCSACLSRWKASYNSSLDVLDQDPPKQEIECPVCRATGPYTEDTELRKLIERTEVVCVEDGCKWTGDLADYDDHLAAKHTVQEPCTRKLRSSDSTTGRVTYHF